MVKKICPVCDHVMRGNHYCRFCKRWVGHPNVIHATYYLNERHPEDETGCEYHQPSFMDKAPERKKEAYVRAKAASAGGYREERSVNRGGYSGKSTASGQAAGSRLSQTWNKSPLHKAAMIIGAIIGINVMIEIVIFVLAMILGVFL